MRILIAPPGDAETLTGNWRTAWRWEQLLNGLGHDVEVAGDPANVDAEVLVALHARRCAPLVERVLVQDTAPVVIVALTGTDVYRDLDHDRGAQSSVRLADRLVVLQQDALDRLPDELQEKARVIYQSAVPLTDVPGVNGPAPHTDTKVFSCTVVANLRSEKDPLRAVHALAQLSLEVPIEVHLVGATIDEGLANEARALERTEPRFHWLGSLSYATTRTLIAASDVVVISSLIEGSCNVLSEALVDGAPVLTSRIPGLVGTLGEEYPGYFDPGDTEALATLLARVHTEPAYRDELREAGAGCRSLVEPAAERDAWRSLLTTL